MTAPEAGISPGLTSGAHRHAGWIRSYSPTGELAAQTVLMASAPQPQPAVALDPGLVDEIVKRILVVVRPERILLFGSRARRDADPRSDIDLAISAPSMTPSEWVRVLDSLDDAETLLPIQAVRLEESPAGLRERILREGIVLYARPEAGR